jgi:hypothetical protein
VQGVRHSVGLKERKTEQLLHGRRGERPVLLAGRSDARNVRVPARARGDRREARGVRGKGGQAAGGNGVPARGRGPQVYDRPLGVAGRHRGYR